MLSPAPGWTFVMLNAYEVWHEISTCTPTQISVRTCIRECTGAHSHVDAHANIHARMMKAPVHANLHTRTHTRARTNMRITQVSVMQDKDTDGYKEAVWDRPGPILELNRLKPILILAVARNTACRIPQVWHQILALDLDHPRPCWQVKLLEKNNPNDVINGKGVRDAL